MGERVTNGSFCAGGGGWELENGGYEETWDNEMNLDSGYCWYSANDWYNGFTLGISQSVDLTTVTHIDFDWSYILERNSGDDTWVRIYLDGEIIREGSTLNEDVWDPFSYPVALTGYHTIAIRMHGGVDSYVGICGWTVSAIGSDLPPAPVAAFTGTPTSGETPLSVAFTDLSTNTPTSWLWNFGDGFLSAVQNPTHVYETAGVYTVVLEATNAGGFGVKTRTNYIVVTRGPNRIHPLWTKQIGPL